MFVVYQGAAVINTPPFKNQDILFPVKVNIELVNGNGNAKNGKCSEPIEFTYNPRKDILNASLIPNGQSLGGILAGLPLSTSTTQQSFSSLVNIAPPALPSVTPGIPDVSLLTSTVSTPSSVVLQPSIKEPDVNGKNNAISHLFNVDYHPTRIIIFLVTLLILEVTLRPVNPIQNI